MNISRRHLASRTNRRGAIFIIALAITVILSALLLVYAQEMQTAGDIAANRVAAVQADAVEQGAEQWVMAQLEANTTPLSGTGTGNASTAVDPTTIPAEALQVGGGYFWLLHPDPTQDQTYGFGLVDESGKLNINTATAAELLLLPNMTQDIADSIVAWANTSNAAPAGDAAGTSYYEALPDPYTLKGSAFETTEELLLIKDITPQVLYGYDLNHDGVMSADEQTAANGAAVTNGTTTDSRGFFNYVTCYSNNISSTPGPPGTITQGLININTASPQVLATLPGLTESDADSIISARAGNTSATSASWLSQAISQQKAQAISRLITVKSYQYSADIVAVSGDARAYKRVRIVVDCRTQPAKIIYRKDITSLGWPLPADVRESMRAGKGVPQDVTGTTNAQGNSVF